MSAGCARKDEISLAADFTAEVVSASAALAGVCRIFYEKDWVPGTGSNFRTVIARNAFS